MKTLLLTFLFFTTGCFTFGQTTFQKTYDVGDFDFGHSVQQTTDGGYILFGQTNNNLSSPGQDMLLIKTDSDGNELWSQTYGEDTWEFGISVQQISDGGYILCGSYSGLGSDSLALVRTDQDGNVIWNKRYSGTVDRDVGQFVQQTTDGGFIAVGFTGPPFGEHIYMVKTDIDGNEEWNQVHESSGRQSSFGVRQTSDGGYVVVGETDNEGFGGKDMYLVKTNSSGDIVWTKTYGTPADEIGRALSITTDDGFILIGFEDFDGGNVYLVKTDLFGNELWSEYYGGAGWDMGHCVQQTSDGGYILAGRKESSVTGTNDMYSIKTDYSGVVEWESTFPMGIMSDAMSVQQTTDGGYVLFGSTTDTINGLNSDMYLVKTDGFGVVSIDEQVPSSVQIVAYPNPFTAFTTIVLEDPLNREFSFALLNSNGQMIRSIDHVTSGEVRLERAHLAHGLYFFQITSNAQLVATGKLVVQ